MPISDDAFREPELSKYKDRYPLSYDKKQRYTDTVVNPKVTQGRSNSIDGSGWKQPGYNPNHNSTTIERINITNDSPQIRKY